MFEHSSSFSSLYFFLFQAEREKTKGKNWFDMKAPEITEEVKSDMLTLQMRGVTDPKRFYKGNDIRGMPKFFEVSGKRFLSEYWVSCHSIIIINFGLIFFLFVFVTP